MKEVENLVRFDWAIKRLLRNKADYCVVEGLLTVIIGRPIKIKSLLESESNQENDFDKFNRVDLLAEDEDGELMIFEIQNNRELSYFHRMAYGTSKVVSEYLSKGDRYEKLRKVYSINIVYFSLGQGDDYAYHGKTEFVSMHNPNDILKLTPAQQKAFNCVTPSDIFPEYYILRVDKFDDVAKTPLDEWISFLKSSTIPDGATAPGLKEAKELLRIDNLSESERKLYYKILDDLRYQQSVIETGRFEGRIEGIEEGLLIGQEKGMAVGRAEGIAVGRAEGRVEGRAEGRAEGVELQNIEHVNRLRSKGFDNQTIADLLGLELTFVINH